VNNRVWQHLSTLACYLYAVKDTFEHPHNRRKMLRLETLNLKYFLGTTGMLLLMLTGCSNDFVYFPNSIQEEVKKGLDSGYDGIIVYVNQAGKSSLYRAGWKDRAKKTPAAPNALFKIASISKLYIAAAVAKLVADQSLSLDTTLSTFIPDVDGRIAHADKITLRMLIQHRSGIPEFIYHPDFAKSDPQDSYLTTAALIYDRKAHFEPGTSYKYSNTNYLLIGEILNRTLGYSYHDYIKDKILKPLGLKNTFGLQSDIDSNQLMSGYQVNQEDDFKVLQHTRPSGSMIATAEDVGIFLRALIDGTLLTPKEQAIYSSIYVYEHTGWLPGYTSIARYHEDLDAVVILFVSTSDSQMFWIGLERFYSRIVRALERNSLQ